MMTGSSQSAFDADTQSLTELFRSPDSFYQVPDYQRPYSWREDEISILWDDLKTAYEKNEDEYFLGTMIFVTDGKTKEVVDGQQRLTTLTVLNCVLRDYFLKYIPNELELSASLRDAIKAVVGEKTRVRFSTGSRDYIYFQQEIVEGLQISDDAINKKDWEKKPYYCAAKFLKTEVTSFLKQDFSRIRDFIEYLMTRVKVISIKCERRDFAIKLFMIVNNRGLDLYESDIFKSFLVGKSETEETRKALVLNWGEIEKYVEDGDDYFGDMDDLLTYFTYYTIASNPEKSNSEELMEHYKDVEAQKIMHEFSNFANEWHRIWDSNERWSLPFYYLRDQRYWRTIITTAKIKNFEPFEKLVLELRRMFYSYWIAGNYSSKFKQTSFNILKKVKEGASFNDILELIEEKMSEDEVIKDRDTNLEDEVDGEKWVKPLLALMDYYENDGETQDFIEITNKGAELEHILPWEWNKSEYWKSKWNEANANLYLGRLGNLALISGIKNKRGSNESFDIKKEKYLRSKEGKTKYLLTKEVFERNNTWTVDEVRNRGEVLVAKVKKLLDKPTAFVR